MIFLDMLLVNSYTLIELCRYQFVNNIILICGFFFDELIPFFYCDSKEEISGYHRAPMVKEEELHHIQ